MSQSLPLVDGLGVEPSVQMNRSRRPRANSRQQKHPDVHVTIWNNTTGVHELSVKILKDMEHTARFIARLHAVVGTNRGVNIRFCVEPTRGKLDLPAPLRLLDVRAFIRSNSASPPI